MGRYYRQGDSRSKQGDRPSAAALAYDHERDRAPKVVAAGSGKLAEQIIALAKENNIPTYEDPVLVACLQALDVGAEIPPELYRVVAEVLAYVYRVSQRVR